MAAAAARLLGGAEVCGEAGTQKQACEHPAAPEAASAQHPAAAPTPASLQLPTAPREQHVSGLAPAPAAMPLLSTGPVTGGSDNPDHTSHPVIELSSVPPYPQGDRDDEVHSADPPNAARGPPVAPPMPFFGMMPGWPPFFGPPGLGMPPGMAAPSGMPGVAMPMPAPWPHPMAPFPIPFHAPTAAASTPNPATILAQDASALAPAPEPAGNPSSSAAPSTAEPSPAPTCEEVAPGVPLINVAQQWQYAAAMHHQAMMSHWWASCMFPAGFGGVPPEAMQQQMQAMSCMSNLQQPAGPPSPVMPLPPMFLAPFFAVHPPSHPAPKAATEERGAAEERGASTRHSMDSGASEDEGRGAAAVGNLHGPAGNHEAVGAKRSQPDDGAAAASANPSKGSRKASRQSKVCKNCGATSTPFWRKDKSDGSALCNACGLYHSKNYAARPKALWKADEAPGGGALPPPRVPAPWPGPRAGGADSGCNTGHQQLVAAAAAAAAMAKLSPLDRLAAAAAVQAALGVSGPSPRPGTSTPARPVASLASPRPGVPRPWPQDLAAIKEEMPAGTADRSALALPPAASAARPPAASTLHSGQFPHGVFAALLAAATAAAAAAANTSSQAAAAPTPRPPAAPPQAAPSSTPSAFAPPARHGAEPTSSRLTEPSPEPEAAPGAVSLQGPAQKPQLEGSVQMPQNPSAVQAAPADAAPADGQNA